MFYFVHYFLGELSFSNRYENGHPCVIRDIFLCMQTDACEIQVLSLQAKAVEYTFAATNTLYSFGFSCIFSP